MLKFVDYTKYTHKATGEKYYRSRLIDLIGHSRLLRRRCHTASAAEEYGFKFVARFKRLFITSETTADVAEMDGQR